MKVLKAQIILFKVVLKSLKSFEKFFFSISLSLMKSVTTSFEVLPLHQAQINLFKVVLKSLKKFQVQKYRLAEFLIFSLGCTNEPDGDNCHNNVEKFELFKTFQTFQHYFKQINLSLMKSVTTSFEVLPLHQAQVNLFKVVLKSLNFSKLFKLFNTTLNKLI
eukprot:sb/3472740/